MPDIKIKSSPLHGLGIFTEEAVREGEVIHVDWVVIANPDDLQGKVGGYGIAWSDEEVAYILGPISLTNHSTEPNANWHYETDPETNMYLPKVGLTALRDIAAGEEILIDYGEDYWSDSMEVPTQIVNGSGKKLDEYTSAHDFRDADLVGGEATADYCFAHQEFCGRYREEGSPGDQ